MVPVARRNLFQEKTRLFIATGGVAFALLLILALDGIVAGSLFQVTAYMRNTGADLYLAQSGVRTMHMSVSALPLDAADAVQSVAGVAEVAPILYTTNPVVAGERRSPAYVIGFDPAAKRGGPWRMAAGSANLAPGEAVFDVKAAATLGVGLGDGVQILGSRFVLRGLSRDTSSITNSMAFVRFDDFARLRDVPATASYLLVWLDPGVSPADGAAGISAAVPGVEAMSRTQFVREEGRLVRDMTAQLMVIMNSVGFVVGLVAVSLTIYTLTLAKVREYGVLRAMGARRWWLYRLVFAQAGWSVALGATAAVVLTFALSWLFAALDLSTSIRVEPGSVLKVVAGAALMSLLAAGAPIQRVNRIDPAEVFRHG